MDVRNAIDDGRQPLLLRPGLAVTVLLACVAPYVLLGDARWASPFVHTAVETVCALTSIILAYCLTALPSARQTRVPFAIPLGFLAMGVLDAFHAVSTPGGGFVLLRGFASLAGGLGFACMDLAPRPRAWLVWSTLLAAGGLGTLTALDRPLFPACLVEGRFTAFAIGLHAVAGASYLVGALRLRLHPNRIASDERRWLLGIAGILSLSAFCFPFSELWGGSWWSWHFFRLTAGGLILAYLVHQSRRTWAEHLRLEEHLRQSQKVEALGRLAGAVAHDFNNLLMLILGLGDLATRRATAGASVQGHLEQIQETARRGTALTGQLLAFSRRQVVKPKVLDLNAVVAGMEQMIRRLAGENIELEIVRGSDLGRVKADPGHVEQVIMNLVVNARDAMPGGGRITIETGNHELKSDDLLRGEEVRAGRYVTLAVRDTGCGVDPEVLGRLFEPFFTTKEAVKGTGLGLSTVDGILRQNGGHVVVQSTLGRGSSFQVRLPRVEEAIDVAAAPAADPAPAHTSGAETILLVEDSADLRMMMSEGLGMFGYQILEAGDGQEAISLLGDTARRIDLLMSDVVLPGELNGFDLARRVISLRPDVKVLLLTGYTDHPAMHGDSLQERIAILHKPVALAPLARRVREVLDAPALAHA